MTDTISHENLSNSNAQIHTHNILEYHYTHTQTPRSNTGTICILSERTFHGTTIEYGFVELQAIKVSIVLEMCRDL